MTEIAKLLGEENEKRLQDAITDILIQQAEKDIEEKYKYDYIVAFDDIYDKVKNKIAKEFEEKLVAKYREKINKMTNIEL